MAFSEDMPSIIFFALLFRFFSVTIKTANIQLSAKDFAWQATYVAEGRFI